MCYVMNMFENPQLKSFWIHLMRLLVIGSLQEVTKINFPKAVAKLSSHKIKLWNGLHLNSLNRFWSDQPLCWPWFGIISLTGKIYFYYWKHLLGLMLSVMGNREVLGHHWIMLNTWNSGHNCHHFLLTFFKSSFFQLMGSVYDLKYFQALPFGLFEFEDL